MVDFAPLRGCEREGSWVAWAPWENPGRVKPKTATVRGRAVQDMLLTDPAEAADFVAKTKMDALAIAIGTSHGLTSSPQAHG
ncbi:MAG: hypothetical protein CM15mP77_1590 [Synechococcus sp.]|nr:MAG: hypothetical protein CM15mP77_1590 [Synechococcus sp.]